MNLLIIVALAIFWVVMAVRQFQRGDMVLGSIFIVAGIALTAFRLKRLRD